MKISFAATLLLSVSASLANAQNITAQSHIDRATVYPQGADVTRVAKVELPVGENVIAFADLPANVDPQSIRVEGSGAEAFEIGSIDTKLLSDDNLANGKRTELEAQIEKLMDERAGLDRAVGDYETERKMLLGLIERTHVQNSKPEAQGGVDVASLDTMMSTVAARLAATSKATMEAKIRQRQIDKDVADLQLKIQNFAPESVQHLQALVHVKGNSIETADFKLTYRVPNAAWHAFYDARLSLPKAGEDSHLTLVRRADIRQATGEDWNDVQLTLSTARPIGNAAAPDLGEQQLDIIVAGGAVGQLAPAPSILQKKDLGRNSLDKMKSELADGVAEADLPSSEAAKEQQAQIQSAGFDANYVISERASIDKNGTSKKVNIGSNEYQPKLMVESVPRLDASAYLSASFPTSVDAPLLAGPVNLFRDGNYVGQIGIGEFASGEEAKFGFGIDDLVKIKRVEVKRLAAREGLLTSSDTQEMAWNISVTNFHSSKMPIRIIDRKPFSSDSKISVADLLAATPATVTDLDHKRGVLAWDLNLEPKTKAEILTGYKITTPKDLHVGMVD